MGIYPELRNLGLHVVHQRTSQSATGNGEPADATSSHRVSRLQEALLQRLIALFRAPAPDGEEYGFSYYSEVALLLRQHGNRGVRFLYLESSQASTEQLRAILFALAEPPKLRRHWLPELWRSYLDDPRVEIVAEAINSLGRYGDRKAKYRVLQLQRHDSADVRGSVLRYVSQMTPRCAPLLLMPALSDEHFLVRETAIDELDRLEVIDALPHLYRYLADDFPQVRQAARTAIDNLEAARDETPHESLRAS